jgi:predicted Zn-dependent protease
MTRQSGGGAPPAILSTHPAGPTRIKDIESRLPGLQPVVQAAARPDRQFAPPARMPAAQAAPGR